VLNPAVNVSVAMPPPSVIDMRAQRAYIDFAIECPTTFDSSCPHWDRIVTLSACCDGAISSTLCGFELTRYISSFGRNGGRWLTEITSLLPMIADAQTCLFSVSSGTGEPWHYSATLLFDRSAPLAVGSRPRSAVPLWRGGKFNQSYNALQPTIHFSVASSNTSKVELVARLSGHGSDSEGCAEFCGTVHRFIVNGNESSSAVHVASSVGVAGTLYGSALQAPLGSLPNSYGTFTYGRDFWSYADVSLHRFDISDQVDRSASNTLDYVALYRGKPPNPPPNRPNSNSAGFDVYSYLVYYN
jgi:Peptide-N-glycosidase F, C terminal